MHRLVTIGLSHYCEKARWALERTGVPFTEEPHAPLLHALHTRPKGGRSVPLLVTDEGVLTDSTDIVAFCDRHAGGALHGDGEARRASLELEERFDTALGPHTRRVVYFHVLADKRAVLEAVRARGVEGAIFRAGYRGIVALMRKAMRIDAAGAARSRERIRAVFEEVSERLRDGRRYLTGDRFTAADLTFAALAAPVVVPPEYGWPLPPLDAFDDVFRAYVERTRETPAGALALRLYKEERRTSSR